ncbi:MAG: 2-dehydropantoate 2-reductase [Gammaproteobacteria bacterium]|nr:2-dehydropantoate 2-reductase [Chromatiales bacterium]MDP6675194.1 2-dehydropantoate 2-reductase [Gammaproteobacteria bacterium]
MQKICIYGVGAIGGLLAARIALSGQPVTGIARGAQLDAIRRNGLTLLADGKSHHAAIECVERPADAGPQDIVFITLKSHMLPAIAADIVALLGPDTVVVTATNGIPWWYFSGLDIDAPVPLDSVDPGGALWRNIGPERAIGAVVFPAARVVEPGVIEHIFGDSLVVGEPDGHSSSRIRALSVILEEAGFVAPIHENIRAELWTKLIANAAYNPVSILTGGTIGDLLDDPGTSAVLKKLMDECTAVASALGVGATMGPGVVLERTRVFAAHKTSMLQDLEAGRSVELDPIVGAVHEMAGRIGVDTPALDFVVALAGQRARLAGCY